MTDFAYRSTAVESDNSFDNPKMARYVSNIDIRYDMAVPVWLECIIQYKTVRYASMLTPSLLLV